MKKIYLASPYSHHNKEVREHRFDYAARVMALMSTWDDIVIFSPICHSHPIALYNNQMSFTFWERLDREFLKWADEMWVLPLPGWKESTGVNAEFLIMDNFAKPVNVITKLLPLKLLPMSEALNVEIQLKLDF